MNSVVAQNIIRFILLFAIQIIVLNEIELHGFINPYIYPLFILLLPIEIPTWLLLLLAFGTGLTMDFFTSSLGLHAAACVLMAFARPAVLDFNRPRGGYETGDRPTIKSLGFRWFLIYAAVLIVIHHVWFFLLEVFSLIGVLSTVSRIVISSVISLLLMLAHQYLSNR